MRIKPIFRSKYHPISQWENFIGNRPDQISESVTDNTMVLDFTVSEDLMLIAAIHSSINNSCYYRKDVSGRDTWKIMEYLGDSGDCEDFALTKRALLIHAGIPASCLIPLVCSIKRSGEGHCVLILKELANDYVLDLHRDKPVELLEDALKRVDPIAILHNGVWCTTVVKNEL